MQIDETLRLLDLIEKALEGYEVEHERVAQGNDEPGYSLRVWGSDRANLVAAIKSHVPLLRHELKTLEPTDQPVDVRVIEGDEENLHGYLWQAFYAAGWPGKHTCGELADIAEKAAKKFYSSPVRESSGWQPIETAPKDGTKILAAQEVRMSRSGHKLGGYVEICRFVGDDWTNGKWVNASGITQPTHWKPLEAAPLSHIEDQGAK